QAPAGPGPQGPRRQPEPAQGAPRHAHDLGVHPAPRAGQGEKLNAAAAPPHQCRARGRVRPLYRAHRETAVDRASAGRAARSAGGRLIGPDRAGRRPALAPTGLQRDRLAQSVQPDAKRDGGAGHRRRCAGHGRQAGPDRGGLARRFPDRVSRRSAHEADRRLWPRRSDRRRHCANDFSGCGRDRSSGRHGRRAPARPLEAEAGATAARCPATGARSAKPAGPGGRRPAPESRPDARARPGPAVSARLHAAGGSGAAAGDARTAHAPADGTAARTGTTGSVRSAVAEPRTAPSVPAPVPPEAAPTPPPPPPPTAPPVPPAQRGRFVVLNFDNADIETVIQAASEIVGFNYVLAPDVRGKVTVQTSGRIAQEEVFGVLLAILEVQGFTAGKSGNLYNIVPIVGAR